MKIYLFILYLSLVFNSAFSQSDTSILVKESIATPDTTFEFNIDSMINFSKTFLGLKYRYGGIKPSTGFDCSGFTRYVFLQFGYPINRTAREQYKQGLNISQDSLQPGDLVFFRYKNRKGQYYIGHVGMVIHIDTCRKTFDFIHSCRRGITISNSTSEFYAKRLYGFKRLINTEKYSDTAKF